MVALVEWLHPTHEGVTALRAVWAVGHEAQIMGRSRAGIRLVATPRAKREAAAEPPLSVP